MDARNVLVTGASRGVGECLSLRLAEKGHRVFAMARNETALRDLADRGDGRIVPFALDICRSDEVEGAVGAIESDHGPVDVLVNNAGVVENRNFAEQDVEMIDRIVDTNLKGALYCTRFVIPHMMERKRGRIVNISSVAGTRGIPGQVAYGASKWGMNGFADALAQELIPHGILVTTICPGAIDTPLWDAETNPYPGDLKGVMRPEEIADMVEFLLAQPDHTLYKRLVVFPTNEWH